MSRYFLLPLVVVCGVNASGQSSDVAAKSSSSVQYADQVPGIDASCKIRNAIEALPRSGGVVDARSLAEATGSGGLCPIDPGSGSNSQTHKPVTILLGPTTYRFHQIVLRANLTLMGMGSYSSQGTIVQAVGMPGAPATVNDALIVLPNGEAASAQAITGVRISGIRFLGAVGNTAQPGIQLLASLGPGTGGGLWWSYFTDLTFIGFNGITIDLEAVVGSAQKRGMNQFLRFEDVKVYRTSTASSYDLKLLGAVAQVVFDNCDFEGPGLGPQGGTNVYIAPHAPSTSYLVPNSIDFRLVTNQNAAQAFDVSGCLACRFFDTHIENTYGGFQFNTLRGLYTNSVSADGTYFGIVGQNNGKGYLFNINTNQGNYLISNSYNGPGYTPDHWFLYSNGGSPSQVNQLNNYDNSTSTLLANSLTASTNPLAVYCGISTTCQNMQLTNARVLAGTVTLSGGLATVSGIRPPFSQGVNCTCSDDTTAANACSAKEATPSSIALRGNGADEVSYICFGN